MDMSPKTPEALRKLYQLLDDDGAPLYSARTIAKVLESVNVTESVKSRARITGAKESDVQADQTPVTGRCICYLPASQGGPQNHQVQFMLDCPALAAATDGDGQDWAEELSRTAVKASISDPACEYLPKILTDTTP